MMNFRLAELRKKHNLTQQQLGEILCVSYQTISKWENGAASPDIWMLPKISGYFGVSVDVLLGLAPLEESYTPSNSGKVEYWEEKLEYLKRTRKAMWNKDYIEFLVRDVWKISKPVTILDCGCGYGSLGMLLMPMFPAGSKYIGIDFSPAMIEADGLFIQGMDYEKLCQHDGLEKMWQTELKEQNRDYSIAMKIPHYMKHAGLKNISCRLNDKVTILEPEQNAYGEILESLVSADHWNDEKTDDILWLEITARCHNGR